MDDSLDVSGGTTSVSTEDLERSVEQLGRLSANAGALAARLTRLEQIERGGLDTDQAHIDIEVAARLLDVVSQRASILQLLLATAARGYEYQERVVASLAASLSAGAGQAAGSLLPGIAIGAGFLTS